MQEKWQNKEHVYVEQYLQNGFFSSNYDLNQFCIQKILASIDFNATKGIE